MIRISRKSMLVLEMLFQKTKLPPGVEPEKSLGLGHPGGGGDIRADGKKRGKTRKGKWPLK